MSLFTLLAALSVAIWLYLLLFHGGFWREGLVPPAPPPPRWPEIVAIVPARDEAETIATSIGSLLRQRYPGRFSIVLVDDHSSDGTAAIALRTALAEDATERLDIVGAAPLPPGWSGKLWAVNEGLRHAAERHPDAEYVLLTDADIAHDETNLAELAARAEVGHLDLVSQMVLLRCRSFAERALVPAFVFFFAKLYPFRWVRNPKHRLGAAAGGSMLVRRAALERIGGVACIRDALIDDCALGQKIKATGGRVWLGLTAQARSLRPYTRLGDIWRMIARTAYTQLRYSPLLLVGAVLGMILTYLAPPLLVWYGGETAILAGLGWLFMAIAFMPILRLYQRPLAAASLLPLIALFYTAATIDSARRHWQGRGGEWKGRVRQRDPQ